MSKYFTAFYDLKINCQDIELLCTCVFYCSFLLEKNKYAVFYKNGNLKNLLSIDISSKLVLLRFLYPFLQSLLFI